MSAAVNAYPVPGTYWLFIGDAISGRVDYTYNGIVCTGFTGTGSIVSGDAPYFTALITEPSTITWHFDLRDTSLSPSPVWRSPMDVATNAFGTGCSIVRNPEDNSPVIAYTGSPVADSKADAEMLPDSIRLGWIVDGEWRLDILDSAGTFGERVAVAVDSNGDPYVAYVKDSEPMVARRLNNQWYVEPVSSEHAAANYIDITVDESDVPHVVFYASTTGALVYATYVGSRWDNEVVDDAGNVGQYCSIGIMRILNWPSIAYYDSTNRNLKFARKENGIWVIRIVDESGDVGRNGNLALDPSGVPYICYQTLAEPANVGLRVAWLQPDGWITVSLAQNSITGYDISMVIDDLGIIHISYRDFEHLRYTWYNGVAWGVGYDLGGVAPSGMTDIAVDENGRPSIVFWDGADLKYVDTTTGAYNGPMDVDVTTLRTVGGGGGCFVATAAFGSVAAAGVEALTSVRDGVVCSGTTGSQLVGLYYAVSPEIADSLRTSDAAKAILRQFLR